MITATNSGKLVAIKLPNRFHLILALPMLLGILILLLQGSLFLYNYLKADLDFRTAEYLLQDNQPTNAFRLTQSAINRRPQEPQYIHFAAEISGDIATLAFINGQSELADQFHSQAITYTQQAIILNPYDLNLWKDQASLYIALTTIDTGYLQKAVQSLEHAHQLAPTEPKILYNLALLYARLDSTPARKARLDTSSIYQTSFPDNQRAIQTLQQTIQLKSDYIDAYYALALFQHEQAVDAQGKIINPELNQQSIQNLDAILTINPEHPQVLEKLEEWKK